MSRSNQQYEEINDLLARSQYEIGRCPTCGSRGDLVGPEQYVWPDSTFKLWGKVYPCDCETQVTLMRAYLLAHIPNEYWRLSHKDYFGDPKAWEAADEYLSYWKGMRRQGIGMEFHSERQGTGKTMLATYIARELVKKDESVYYIAFRSIMDLYTRPYEARKQEEDRLHDSTILVLDEIIPPISAAQEHHFGDKFEELIRDRTNYGKITILTTNMEPDKLDQHYPRTYSLLSARQTRVEIEKTQDDVRKNGLAFVLQELARNGEERPIS